MLSRFHTIPACHGRTDGRTDRIAISISRVSVLTRAIKIDETLRKVRQLKAKVILQHAAPIVVGRCGLGVSRHCRDTTVRYFSTLFCTFWPPLGIRPWDNRGKCYMDRKRIQCL